ncbi:protein induced by osmotic stress [Scheffersomyces amazonensis]|uniref:protein induced by osmotic stress n=1 Tax=Scheffersomyces amazonensis TaxID=1078765 RepID=UPI00315CC192
MSASSTTVFVSGATGFIAQQTIVQLLQKGYNVVGSVRSTEKGETLAKNLNNSKFHYAIVKGLSEIGAFDEALKAHPEVTIFLHTASPVTFAAEDNERDILIPAIDGTKNVLASIKKYGPQIKKVVLTSSIFGSADFGDLANPDFEGGEDTWNDPTYEVAKQNGATAYSASKAFAEKAAWKFLETEKPNFTLAVINPVFVFGPQAFESSVKSLNETAKLTAQVLDLKPDSAIPDLAGLFVDVRDVAKAHILAFELPEAAGKRFVIQNGRFDFQQVLDSFRKQFPELKDQVPVGKPGSSDFSAFKPLHDNNARTIFKIDYISLDKVIKDSISQILAYKAKN